MAEKLVLIDGHSILNRAFYGVPDLTNSEGIHTNAIYGFLNIMFKILEEEQADYLFVAFDLHAPTFRHKMFADYKGTRKPMLPELQEQVPLMKELLQAMGICTVSKEGFEADDILGTLSRLGERAGMEVSIVSGDRDMLQLATGKVQIRIPKTKKGTTEIENYYEDDVKALYGVTPTEFIDMKGLMGDSSDNIPGVPGIGEKTAAKIIIAYHSIEEAARHISELKPPKAARALEEFYDQAVFSRDLARIITDVPLEIKVSDGKLGTIYTEKARQMVKRFEFKSMYNRFTQGETLSEEKEAFSFHSINDYEELETILGRAKKKGNIGFSVLQDVHNKKVMCGFSFAYNDKDVYFAGKELFLFPQMMEETLKDLICTALQAACFYLKDILKLVALPDLETVYDCNIAAYLLNPLKESYSYDDIARDYLKRSVPAKSELVDKKAPTEESLIQVCGYEAVIAYSSAAKLRTLLEEQGMLTLYHEVEMPLVYSLNRMELAGVKVKREALKEYGEKLSARISVVESQIYETVGRKFNINSPKQLGEILFGEMGIPGGKKTRTGYSTSADVLEKLKPDYPVAADILEYRQLTKLKSTYADGLAVFIGEDERIHGTFNQTITATGRISSTDPNLQNIPIRMELGRAIRKVFVPQEGYIFVDADYSQIELRLLAHMSGDENLIEAYKEARDIHSITASKVFHVPLCEVTPDLRRNAKAVNFGVVYGISSFGLSQDLSISRKEAAAYIEQYFATYPGIKTYLDDCIQTGKEQGYVTTMFGRRRPIPELKSGNFMQRSFGERIAMNSPLQGTAADIIKIAMIRVDRRLREEGLSSRIVLQVHDELLVEAKKSETRRVKEILETEMRGAAKLSVALEVGMAEGEDWFSAH